MSKRPDYTELEHTADVGIELTAPDLVSALERAAAAMFDVMCGIESVDAVEEASVTVEAREDDLENLLVRWLTELLYVYEGRRMLLAEFNITLLAGGRLEARVGGEPFDPERHHVYTEIKAPTYHDLRIEENEGRWLVRVIFDT